MKTNNTYDGKTLDMAKRFEASMNTKPLEEQIAVGLITKNVLNGCSWEFTRKTPEVTRNMELFKNSKTCSVQEVTYDHAKKITGYLVYMQMGKLLELLGPSNNGPLIQSDVQLAEKHRKEASESLIKKLQSGYAGKIGIFCTNDSQTITISGKAYPAYAVTFKELCTICSKMGYGIVVSGEPRDPQQALQREDAMLKYMVVAPSSNALFIDIAPMGKRK